FEVSEERLFSGNKGRHDAPPVSRIVIAAITPSVEFVRIGCVRIELLRDVKVNVVIETGLFAHVRALLKARTHGSQPRAGGKRAAFFAAFAFSTGEPRERRFAAFHIDHESKQGGKTGLTPVRHNRNERTKSTHFQDR